MDYTLKQVAEIIGASSQSVLTEGSICKLLTDSRSLSIPSQTLFFALVTSKGDGHKYIVDLYKKGVRAFVVSSQGLEKYVAQSTIQNATFLVVEDTLKALQKIALFHRNQFASLPVVGITGSTGKTIVKEWIYQLISHKYNTARSPKSYNSQVGVPLSIWNIDKTTQIGLFEAGISQKGEMQHIAPIILPTIGILTNIGVAHQEGFSSMEEKCREKMKLFQSVHFLIYNSDNPLVEKIVQESNSSCKLLNWSFRDRGAYLFIEKSIERVDSTEIFYACGELHSSFTIPFTDRASIENCLHCLVFMLHLGYSPEIIAERMQRIEPIAMRMEVKTGINDCVVINDAYTADLQSLEIALDFLNRRTSSMKRGKTLILSDIQHERIPINEFYQQVAHLLDVYRINRFIGIGKELLSVQQYFPKNSMFFPSTEIFVREPLEQLFSNEVILVKGSRTFHLEDISEFLEKKVHETILEVNLDAVVHNFLSYKKRLLPQTKMVCMVKASGYGGGSIEIAKTLQEYGCDYVAVATADEGVELRKSGVYIPIIVMNPEFGSLNTLFNYQLEPEVYSFPLLNDLQKTALKHGISSYPIHIKIATGMNRLGFVEGDLDMLVRRFPKEELYIASIFSHLFAADNPQHDDLTRRQIEIFEHCSKRIKEELSPLALRHILNTAGIVRFTGHQMEMVRLGIGLYGVPACGEKGVFPISVLKSNILQIQKVSKGQTVGYGGENPLQRDSLIAIVPIGYADGLNRHLGNEAGYMMVRGKKCPIIGNVCMDATMIDVTDVLDAKEGDEAIIFGKQPSVVEIAKTLKTIPYEVLTSVSSRVKRVYVKE
ncbi:MAG TPA: bifunctional UDP-N-acetylmuramoyl-tripeptide:D-alanyl-D-alanine ligase/alanine racemase [Porphyromonadaceae bacterium]|nr:bifunctional UDP-N-acetylmuramoyl-tripeptide:D-alanyl-D-alanine ligase/alanine racemase [Porphyromonadaceae bacterium]